MVDGGREGRAEPGATDPLSVNLPKICSIDYYDRHLYLPEWRGDLFVLEKGPEGPTMS
jgi:hypothetical protein